MTKGKRSYMNNKIDFVVTWVDGNDLKWQENFYTHQKVSGDKRISRFRDWDNLQYLFRSFEEFTPWVNKIYFVTYGHVPKWLNIHHEKLVIVKHEDYMDKNNLPVFNSHPIEINMHRIEGLSEKFVYFNDDTFILSPLKEETFFKQDLPVNVALLGLMSNSFKDNTLSNNLSIINKHTKSSKYKIILKDFSKWLYKGYGFKLFRTMVLLPTSKFTGFKSYHQPQPFLKNTFIELWEKEEKLLTKVSKSKFRTNSEINQYLFRHWQFITGKFYPDSVKNAYKKRKFKNIRTQEDAKMVAKHILSGKFEMYCVNDALTDNTNDFDVSKSIINNALESLLPNKSSFEL
ncbi:MAG: Stealth protein CR1, conserved region 1 [uncultured Sulfurovum sp.]|uniref:Stealth protein CR1, conserved region 1 n=1 Tax=uncultured Sulfurovum sp. TaxID=269237 RepID=A0A6S6T9C6_9BACT|nr:MAG: Stealth protein CR1, conserved region 1 [uncultured Sulfurovum sp.]